MPQRAAYAAGEGENITIQVNYILRFTNVDLEISFIARIVRRERVPNILSGQLGLIDFSQYRSVPETQR